MTSTTRRRERMTNRREKTSSGKLVLTRCSTTQIGLFFLLLISAHYAPPLPANAFSISPTAVTIRHSRVSSVDRNCNTDAAVSSTTLRTKITTSLNSQYPRLENENDDESLPSIIANRVRRELEILSQSTSIAYHNVIRTKFPDKDGEFTDLPSKLVTLCDDIDMERTHLTNINLQATTSSASRLFVESLQLRLATLELSRYHLLIKLLQSDYQAYIATASFLSPSRIPRLALPNVQDVPLNDILPSVKASDDDDVLVDDCTLDDIAYQESILDKALLALFRFLVEKNTDGVSSEQPGILGLLEQGRKYMLVSNQTDVRQHQMVKETLADLMTPFLPPFYRIFMSGIVPPGLKNTPPIQEYAGKQVGPWFYAPWLTTMITPVFFGFLVGPSYPNRRKDGERGGLVVEKCKFLQESGCKGLCLNICKLPTEQFFKDELGLELTVSPNFATQECQWSFGETPLPPEEDASFPRGCLVGCESRAVMAETYTNTRGSCS